MSDKEKERTAKMLEKLSKQEDEKRYLDSDESDGEDRQGWYISECPLASQCKNGKHWQGTRKCESFISRQKSREYLMRHLLMCGHHNLSVEDAVDMCNKTVPCTYMETSEERRRNRVAWRLQTAGEKESLWKKKESKKDEKKESKKDEKKYKKKGLSRSRSRPRSRTAGAGSSRDEMVEIKREDLEAVVLQLEEAAKLASSAAEVCSSVADSYKQNETSLEMAAGWLRGLL